MIVFLLVVILQSSPTVIMGVDGEYRTARECIKGRAESIKENPSFDGRIKCMKVVLEDTI